MRDEDEADKEESRSMDQMTTMGASATRRDDDNDGRIGKTRRRRRNHF